MDEPVWRHDCSAPGTVHSDGVSLLRCVLGGRIVVVVVVAAVTRPVRCRCRSVTLLLTAPLLPLTLHYLPPHDGPSAHTQNTGHPTVTLRVNTPPAVLQLTPPEKAALADMAKSCCSSVHNTSNSIFCHVSWLFAVACWCVMLLLQLEGVCG